MTIWRSAIAVTICLFLAGCGEKTIFSNLPQREANEIVSVLEQTGVETSVKSGSAPRTVTISVPSGQVSLALKTLANVGLPRPSSKALTDILPSDSWMRSQNHEDARLAYGIGQDLASTLQKINGIRDARVHVALARQNTLGQVVTPPSASVLVRYDEALIGPEFQSDIAVLVSNAVAGLDYSQVSVTMVPFTGPAGLSASAARLSGKPGLTDILSGLLRLALALGVIGLIAWLLYFRPSRNRNASST